MDPALASRTTVSNLVMTFDDPATAVAVPDRSAAPFEQGYDDATKLRMRAYDLLAPDPAFDTVNEPWHDTSVGATAAVRLPDEADDHMHDRRSAFEIAFILLAAALAILVATPPLTQLFLALQGVRA